MIALKVGCGVDMNWIQARTNLLRTYPIDGRYLIGVSGGRDSVALLHWLSHIGYENLVICHLNHQLRGRSSDADARFVKKLAEKCGAGLELQVANVRALAKREKTSVEAAARKARYSFFASAANRHCCQTLFLAHHADDLVETFVLNLIRGAGIREYHLVFREDSTNKSLAPTRNRIRHRIIPYLERTVGRNIRENIWRTAIIAAEEEKWMNQELPESPSEELSLTGLRALPLPLQRRAILKWLRARSVSDVGFDVIEAIRALLDQDARMAKVNLPKGRHVRRRAGRIFIEQ
jgi:tRNA(Ile)-lysidine synthase